MYTIYDAYDVQKCLCIWLYTIFIMYLVGYSVDNVYNVDNVYVNLGKKKTIYFYSKIYFLLHKP